MEKIIFICDEEDIQPMTIKAAKPLPASR